MFTGMAKPPEKKKIVTWGKEKLKKSFTVSGAEEVWREKHAKEIQELTAINASLSDEDRAKAMEKLEKDIKRTAVVKVAGNYGAAALVTTALIGEGLLIGNYKNWATKLSENKYVGFVGKQAIGIRGGLDALSGKMGEFVKEAKTRGKRTWKNLTKSKSQQMYEGLSNRIVIDFNKLQEAKQGKKVGSGDIKPSSDDFIDVEFTDVT